MVLLEFSITPLDRGASVSQYVAQCLEIIAKSGLRYEMHSMGTIVEGEFAEVFDLLRVCMEEIAKVSDRVTCTAKFDYRAGQTGRIQSKIQSVKNQTSTPTSSV
jgi:uncharacterized protein (TIGR00106 family)